MLAKAVAGMNGLTFFNCAASSLVSKWRGESEKLVRTLFTMARHYSPSIIFIDEIDALVSTRGGTDEHEASRRLKSELFTQMDGLATSLHSGGLVLVLATTNCPWDLDEALRRRLEKRIYIPLPSLEARLSMFKLHMCNVKLDASAAPPPAAALPSRASSAGVLEPVTSASVTLARAVELIKAELGLEPGGLNATQVVVAASEALGVELAAGGNLKEKVAQICKELDIELGWARPKAGTAPGAGKAETSETPLRQEAAEGTTTTAKEDDPDAEPELEPRDGHTEQAMLQLLAAMTDGYSGADVKMVCRDAAMAPMRRSIAGKSAEEVRRMKERGELDVSVSYRDFEDAIRRIQPSVSSRDAARYEEWTAAHGSV